MKQLFQPKKTQLWNLVLLLAAAIIAMVFAAKCSHRPPQSPFADTYSKAQGDTLDVAIELNPTIYSIHGDSIAGRDYAMLQQISQKAGVPIKLHPFVPLSHAMDYLDKGLYDVVVASMPLTSKLKERFLMTDPVYLDREVLVQRVDTAGKPIITSQIQLAGDTVWIPESSPIASRIANLSREIGDTIYIKSLPDYNAEHLFLLVDKGIIPYAVVNERIAREMAAEYPNINISIPISFTQFQAWAVNKNNQQLCDSLNSWLRQIQ